MTDLSRLLTLSGLTMLQEGAADRYLNLFTNCPPELMDDVKEEVKWAYTNLKDDRIVWYLRFYRIAILKPFSQKDEKIKIFYGKITHDLAQKEGVSANATISATSRCVAAMSIQTKVN
jgi:hypothetical protein